MLPGPIRSRCEQLLAAPVTDAQHKVSLVEPPLEKRIQIFISALRLLDGYAGDAYYSLYVCTVFGYRRLVVRDGGCVPVDNLMLTLLQDRPEIIPDDCYADRLPPLAPVLRQVRALHRVYLKSQFGTAPMERLAAD